MIVQDSQTGALHQVPDQPSGYGEYGERVVYDGLGNPVGRLSGPFDFIGNALKSVVSAIPGVGPAVSAISAIPGIGPAISAIPGIGPIVSQLLPGGAMGPPAPPFPQIPGLPGFPTPQGFPMGSGVPMPAGFPGLPSFRPPWPAGWVRPPLPYTGLGPRRLYMRCAVWPGPRGLVPGYAQNLPPQPLPGVPPQALPYMGGGRRHHRRHRR
jgi:hypothetical protein